jgi:hypothetical protein
MALFSRPTGHNSKQEAAGGLVKKGLRSASPPPASQEGPGGQGAGSSGLGMVPTVELFVAVYVEDLPPQVTRVVIVFMHGKSFRALIHVSLLVGKDSGSCGTSGG